MEHEAEVRIPQITPFLKYLLKYSTFIKDH